MDRETNSTANFYDTHTSEGRHSDRLDHYKGFISPPIKDIQEDITKIPRSAHYTNVLSRAQHVLDRSALVKVDGNAPIELEKFSIKEIISQPRTSYTKPTTSKTHAVLEKANQMLERSAGYSNERFNGLNDDTFAIDQGQSDGLYKTASIISPIGRNNPYITKFSLSQSADKNSNPRDVLSRINNVLQTSSKIVAEQNYIADSISNNFGHKSMGHTSSLRDREFETPKRTYISASPDGNKSSFGTRGIRTTEYESRIPESIQRAYNEVLRTSQELIFKTEDNLTRTAPLAQLSGKKEDRKSSQGLRSPPKVNESKHIRTLNRFEMSPPGVNVIKKSIKTKFVEEFFDDGSVYRGEKLRTQRQGRGEFVQSDGSKYEGEWENDKKNGYGIQKFASGHIEYDGEWKDDLYHGNGIMINPEPKESYNFDFKNFDTVQYHWLKYEGEFMNGKMHGLGTLTLFGNERYVGKLKYNKIHGAGVFYRKNGDVISGEWENNLYVRNI